MKSFVINLDRDVERMEAATRQLSSHGIAFERLSAVYAADMDSKLRSAAVNHRRWRIAMGRCVRPGEIGCALSHFSIYRKMLMDDIPLACIFEDDVVFTGDVKSCLDLVESVIDTKRAQVVLLSDHTHQKIRTRCICPAKTDMFTEAYVITKPAAANLLRVNYPMQVPCDHWGRFVRLGAIELFHAYPAVANQNWTAYESNIGKSGVRPPKRPFMERVIRHLGFLIDACMVYCERRKCQ